MQSGGAAGDSNPLKWSLKRVLQWLSDLGMDHLKETFAKNHVDGEQLMDLSFQDLEEDLEIANQSECHRILQAINFLRFSGKKPSDSDNQDEQYLPEHMDQSDMGQAHSNGGSLMHGAPMASYTQYPQYAISSMHAYGYPSVLAAQRPMAIPISSLQEYPGVWTIRARVNQKSDILHWNETTYYFTIDLHDSTGSIRAMLVNEVADKFFPVFMENKTYVMFSGGSTVKRAVQRVMQLTSEFEINMAIDAEVQCVADDDYLSSHPVDLAGDDPHMAMSAGFVMPVASDFDPRMVLASPLHVGNSLGMYLKAGDIGSPAVSASHGPMSGRMPPHMAPHMSHTPLVLGDSGAMTDSHMMDLASPHLPGGLGPAAVPVASLGEPHVVHSADLRPGRGAASGGVKRASSDSRVDATLAPNDTNGNRMPRHADETPVTDVSTKRQRVLPTQSQATDA